VPLIFHPNPGTIVLCDFTGFRAPEMVKVRPVVVLSPRFRRHQDVVTVVPLSTRRPEPVEPFHHRLRPDSYPPAADRDAWVKADMVTIVALARLDRVRLGAGEHTTFTLAETEMQAIGRCVRFALGLP
jgi:uncharacterized protein YifN (PemK superfamily)